VELDRVDAQISLLSGVA